MTAGVGKAGDHDGLPPPKKKLWQKYKYILWSLFLLTRRAVINKPYFYLIAKRSKNV